MKNIYHLIVLTLLSIFSFNGFAQIVRMETALGNIDIELHPEAAPNTVTNFLNYMNDGDYNNSFIHRNGRSEGQIFIVQGGGFTISGGDVSTIPTDPPIDNEFFLSNIRGTIAMAKLSGEPDSATSQWFFNVVDNSAVLDSGAASNAGSGGFTVFGTVIDGMDVVDAIAALETSPTFVDETTPSVAFNIDGQEFDFFEVPYLNDFPEVLQEDDAFVINNVLEIDAELNLNSGLNGAWFNPNTPGQGLTLEILPVSNTAFAAWFVYDTLLPADGVTANIGDAGNRWLSGLGVLDEENTTITFDLAVSSGGLFNNSQTVTNTEPGTYGTLTIDFEDCATATATYSFIAQELSGSFPLQRISGENVSLCQRLSSEAN